MKNRAFGLPNMLAFMLVFIILLLTISVIVHQLNLDNKNNYLLRPETTKKEKKYTRGTKIESDDDEFDYTSIEKNLKNAAAQYQKDFYPGFDDIDPMYVTSNKLISLDYLDVLSDGEVICKGYAKITYDNVVRVEPFIKCGKYYKTEGYSTNLE